MAGGEGTRLRPLTSNAPKPMMPIANAPMMEHIVQLLRRHGFEEIVVTVAFMGNQIRNYFGDGSELGVRMVYATEETPLGTAGSVRNARDELDDRFLVISGDVLTDIDLGAIVRFHEERSAVATIGLTAVDDPLEFGIVITHDDGSVERFLEKPTWGQVFSDTINTGIFVLEPEVFDWIADGRQVDFSSEVFPALLEADKPLYGAVLEGYWEDVGTPDAYVRAHSLGMVFCAPLDVKLRPGLVTQPDLLVVPAGLLRTYADTVSRLLLAAETISPSSARFDRVVKRPRYQRERVPEYWIIDQRSETIERWRPDDERPEILADRLIWHPEGAVEPLDVDLVRFFADLALPREEGGG